MVDRSVSNGLVGKTIKEIFNDAEQTAELHACLTSPRGDNFRLRLLQSMEVPLDESAVERLKVESGINECHRHLNRLLRFRMIRNQQTDGTRLYIRTMLGEMAVNAVRQFERRVGADTAQAVYSAALGPNSIRLFLRVYGDRRGSEWDRLPLTYTALEIGRLCLFLPRTIDGISAIDKLNEAGLLVYRDDGQTHMHPLKARSFYQYLREIYAIVEYDRKPSIDGIEEFAGDDAMFRVYG